MSLFKDLEGVLEDTVADVVDDKLEPIELDVQRIGGDVSTLASKIGELMEGLKNHREVIQDMVDSHHGLVKSLNEKIPASLRYPPLFKRQPVGPN